MNPTPRRARPPLLARRHRRRTSRRAGSSVEFALCLPIWLAALSVIYDYSWIVLQRTSLDAALNMGCRSGSFVDPGEGDVDAAVVYAAAAAATWDTFEELRGRACTGCTFSATLQGEYPQRTLRCEVVSEMTPIIGVAFGPLPVTSVQLAHLKWQR